LPRISPELCARCKGYKKLCGLPKCPILEAFRAQVTASTRIKGSLLNGSTPPGILVGEKGYPKVRAYYMIPPGVYGSEAKYYEAPYEWAVKNEPLARIIQLRASLVSASISVEARDPLSLYQSEIGLAALSQKPVDSEVKLVKPPSPRLSFDGISKPRGPTAPALRIKVSGNPQPPKPLEKAIWEDVLARDIVWELYWKGVSIYDIQRAMSLGFLGRTKARRIVPTRWAITAVDEILAMRIREELRGASTIDSIEIYKAEYLGNKFIIILLPGEGTLEWIEAWQPMTVWTKTAKRTVVWRVEEDPLGRKTSEDGGFSAAKLPILENLLERGKTANAVILREITPSYYAPVGNWHIRETVKRAMKKGPLLVASSPEEILPVIRKTLSDPDNILSRSVLLPWGKYRRTRITEFF